MIWWQSAASDHNPGLGDEVKNAITITVESRNISYIADQCKGGQRSPMSNKAPLKSNEHAKWREKTHKGGTP